MNSKNKITGPVFNIPKELLYDFTMNGFARIVVKWFYADTFAKELFFSKEKFLMCKNRIAKAIKTKNSFIYYESDKYLPTIFRKYPIKNKSVAVIGSASPLYEAYVDYFGGKPVTVEYRKIKTNIPNLKTYTPEEAQAKNVKTDYALCISSIEHSGLGRYHDDIDPKGDFKAMNSIKKMIKPNGFLFLQVPVGQDTLIWNETRVYGRNRLLLLLKDWKIIDCFGYEPNLLRASRDKIAKEPIFVLQNAHPGNTHKKLFDEHALNVFSTYDSSRSIYHKDLTTLFSDFVQSKPEQVEGLKVIKHSLLKKRIIKLIKKFLY